MIAVLLATPAVASRNVVTSPYAEYVRARAADAAGMPEQAAAQYAAVLSANPGDTLLATRAYRQALIAGDKPLALRSARLLDSASALPPDGRLLLLAEAIDARDWPGAHATLDRIEREQAFAFMVPIMRAWIAFADHKSDPLAALDKVSGGLAGGYAAEQRALILLAMGRSVEASDVIKALATDMGIRDMRLRLLGAQALGASGDRDRALALLVGNEPAFAALRARLASGKRIAAPVIDASFGLSQLLVRIAIDLTRQQATPLVPGIARLATFAAPENSEAWLATAQLLALTEQPDAALTALDQVPQDDPLAPTARSTLIRILMNQDKKDQALAVMQAVIAKPEAGVADWTLLGDIYTGLDRQADAAAAYGSALDKATALGMGSDRLWSLWLLKGGALEQAGAWPEAKTSLEKALALAPDEAVVLNYLGYAELARRENITEARALIEKANKLRPDDAAITDSLGWAHYLQGDFSTAIAKLEIAVAGDPGAAEINEHLGDAYWASGRRIEARYAWRAALVTADPKASTRLAQKIDIGPTAGDATP